MAAFWGPQPEDWWSWLTDENAVVFDVVDRCYSILKVKKITVS